MTPNNVEPSRQPTVHGDCSARRYVTTKSTYTEGEIVVASYRRSRTGRVVGARDSCPSIEKQP